MKRTAAFIILLFSVMQVYSASLLIFDMDHPIYEEMDALYVMEGKAKPLGIRPWSEIDATHLLERINPSTDASLRLKKRIEGYIRKTDQDFSGIFTASFTPGFAAHSNLRVFDDYDSSYAMDNLNETLLNAGLGMTYNEYIAGFMDFSAGLNFSDALDYSDMDWDSPESTDPNGQPEDRYSEYFSTNIPYVSPGGFSLNFPYRAYVAGGFDAFRVVIGRDRLSWGNGMMGNMMLGDTLPYHDYVSLTFTGSPWFSYQMLMSFFVHSASYSGFTGTEPTDRHPMHGLRFFLGHRFEFSFLDDSLRFAINESVMYQSEDGYFDFRVLNPLMFLHNLYIAYNSNSLFTLELEYSPIKNFSIYAQAAIDDLAVGGESAPPSPGSSSNGWGVMGGLRYTYPTSRGYIYGGAEFVYTSPFLYHRAVDRESSAFDLYYVGTLRVYDGGTRVVARYLSFPFGSDAIAAMIKVGYNDISFFSVEGSLKFLVHGIVDKFSSCHQYGSWGTGIPITPSTENPFSGETGVPEYSFVIGAEGTVDITSYFSIDSAVAFALIWNHDNEAHPVETDFQFSLSLVFEY